jgi:ATP-dependent HslUV protease ATP-binding subunit HslU
MQEMTPREIVAELDKYIVGQTAAKRAVAIALRNRHRRRLLPEDLRDDVIPKNILMIGPTGVGKTEIARRLASLARAPFVKVEATKFTEVGYVGRDVDSMVRDLLQVSIRMVEKERAAEVREQAQTRAIDRIIDLMQPKPASRESKQKASGPSPAESISEALEQLFKGGGAAITAVRTSFPASSEHTPSPPPHPEPEQTEPEVDSEVEIKKGQQIERIRQRLRDQIASGARDEESIQIEIEESMAPPMLQVFGPGQPGEDSGMDMQNVLGSLLPKRRKKHTVTIAQAREIFAAEEAQSLIDHDQVIRDAIERAEQTGIIFVDEMDKIAGRSEGRGGPDVSREGVQRDILPIIEGSTIQTKHGPVRTDYVLFIAAGAFHVSKPSDLIPELQGRLPIRVELESLKKDDFKRILTEPHSALVKQYKALIATEGVSLEFTDDAIDQIATLAEQANSQMENIGARRLHTILERLLDEISFEACDATEKAVTIDAAYVKEKLQSIIKDDDLSRYVL